MSVSVPRGPRRSCCPLWAFVRWWKRGGYIALRASIPAPWKPHFLWSADGRYWWGYVPNKPMRGMRAIYGSLWFAGHVKREKMGRR